MAQATKIEWCDSTLNLMMGCDGCELWNAKAGVKRCYAGTLTERYGGAKGWPVAFEQPAIFAERLKPALDWPDLRGRERPGKPWLNGYPRTIFLDDMGDTFTESLPLDWLAPHIEVMEQSPHIFQFLTKRPKRMRQFFEQLGRVPKNFWLLTTVTSQANQGRVADLLSISGATVYGVSYEPMWGGVNFRQFMPGCARFEDVTSSDGQRLTDRNGCGIIEIVDCPGPYLNWLIVGGESGPQAKPAHPDWVREARNDCRDAGVPLFLKQWGEWAPHSQIATGVPGEFDGVSAHHFNDGNHIYKGTLAYRVGKKRAGRLLDGVEHNGMPMIAEVAA